MKIFIGLLLVFPFLCYCKVLKDIRTTESEGSCPDTFEDWHPNSIFCYLLKSGDDMKTWDDAKKFCRDVGGHLASEQTKAERNYIVNKFKEVDNQAHTWIGLRGPEDQDDRKDPKNWKWEDQTSMSYKNWDDGEPSTNGRCGYMRPERDYKWDDCQCDLKQAFLCKILKKPVPCSPESPDDGWVTVETGFDDFCYYTVTEEATWQAANDDCISRNSSLVSIHSDDENTFVNSLRSHEGWNGLIKIGSKKGGQRKWTDGTSYDFEKWKKNEPNDKGSEDCTEMEGTDSEHFGQWNDISCSHNHQYVCKKWRPGHEPTYPPPTEIPIGHCGDDHTHRLIEFNGYCYKLVGVNKDDAIAWDEADAKCAELGNGYRLASIHSERESAFIYTLLAEQREEGDEVQSKFWFGGSDLEENKWNYTDGTPFDYTHWKDGEPNNSGGEEDCTRLDGFGNDMPGYWNDDQCYNTFGALCKTVVSPSYPQPPERTKCDEYGRKDFFRFNGACYKWESEPKTWDEAEESCMLQHAHLVSILDDVEQAYVFTQPELGIEQEQSWIGLSNKEDQQIYKWSDGWNLEYKNWLSNQETDGDEAKCAVIDVNAFTCEDVCEYPDGNWIAKPCAEKHPYMCKFGEIPPDALKCPNSEWFLFDGSCYRPHGSNNELSWNEAQDYCVSQGGNLMSVGSVEENEAVLKHFVFTDLSLTDVFWIGLRRKEDANGEDFDKDYEWVDGSLNDYKHFAEHYPNSVSGIDACIMVNNAQDQQGDAKLSWKNNNCEVRLQYVCEIPASYEPPTTQVPPTLPPPQPCDPENPADLWVKFPDDQGGDGEFCYLFSETNQKTWDGAKDDCILQGGRMVSIHSTQENDFVVHNLARNGIGWIGYIKDPSTDTFKWTDGSDPDFYRWGNNQPDDQDDMESCVSLQSNTGNWYDESCYNVHEFACKKPSNGTWPTPSPTVKPEGHCRAEFQEFMGYCYAIMGLDNSVDGQQDNINWHDAKDRCNNYAEGVHADLASIHSEREASFITTMLAGKYNDNNTALWTGGYVRVNNQGLYGWSDESNWNYDHWMFGEPNGMGDENNCVRVVNRDWNDDVGKWDDYECDNALGYICKTKASPANNPPLPPEKCDNPEVSGKEFIKFDGSCYKWISDALSWSEAENSCQSMNAHLVSINTPMEQAFVFTRVQSDASWIGLNNQQSRDIFMWSDGWRTSYINWGNQNNERVESCVQMNITNGKWDAVECETKLPYMCKFSQEQPPTPNPNGMCPDNFQDILPNSPYCYMIKSDYREGDGLTWGDAEVECNAYHAKLASIHGEEEMNAIQQALAAVATKDIWIGLQATVKGEWNWVDHSPYDYNNWFDGEPNHNDDFLYCSKIWEEHEERLGKWDDAQCTNLNGYICKIERIPGPTQPPESTTAKITTTTTKNLISTQSSSSKVADHIILHLLPIMMITLLLSNV